MDQTLAQLLNELVSVSTQLQQALTRIKELEEELASRPSVGPTPSQTQNGSIPSNKPAWAP